MIKIKIEKKTRQVTIDKSLLGNDNENLQDNLEFSFTDEFVDGQARLELKFKDDEKTFVTLEKVEETYITPVTNVMTIQGKVYAQLVITEGTSEDSIPVFKSNIFYFYVNESINAETGDREPYIEWIDRANVKLNQIENINIDAVKVDDTTTITITDRNGIEKSVEIHDGEKGDKGDKGETGPAGNGIASIVKTSSEDLIDTYTVTYTNGNTFTYTVTNGYTQDLSDYVKNTDYATSEKGGVIKISDSYGVGLSNGVLYGRAIDYNNYSSFYANDIISKTTLENAITGKELVNKTYVDNAISAAITDALGGNY